MLNVYLTIIFIANYEKLVDRPRSNIYEISASNRYTLGRLVELTLFIRVLGVLTLLYELRSMRLIIETMRNMMLPLFQLLGVLFVVFYIFAIVGMFMFGGMSQADFPTIQDGSTP